MENLSILLPTCLLDKYAAGCVANRSIKDAMKVLATSSAHALPNGSWSFIRSAAAASGAG